MDADRYIASIKRSYLFLFLLALGVGYLAFQEYARVSLVNRSELLQLALGVSHLGDKLPTLKRFTEQDLATISFAARIHNDRAMFKEAIIGYETARAKEHGISVKKIPKFEKAVHQFEASIPWEPFTTSNIPGALIATVPGTQFQPWSGCKTAILTGPSSLKRPFTTIYVGALSMGTLADVRLVYIGEECGLSVRNFLIVGPSTSQPSLTPQWLVGIPANRLSDVLDPYRLLTGSFSDALRLLAFTQAFVDLKSSHFLDAYPAVVKEYITPESRYALFTRSDIEIAIRNLAHSLTGKYYPPRHLDQAIETISGVQETYASIYGVQAPVRYVIDVTPLVSVVLLYLIFIQARRLERHWHNAHVPWIFRDAHGHVGTFIGTVAAYLPLLAVTWIFFAFQDLNGIGIPFNGRIWFLRNLIGLQQLRQLNVVGDLHFVADAYLLLFTVTVYLALRVASQFTALRRTYHRELGA